MDVTHRVILKHDRNYESVSSYLRTALIGTSEMLLSDAVGADFDVELATKRFKFALVPKVIQNDNIFNKTS